MTQAGYLLWVLAGVGLTLAVQGLGWLYWRYWGRGSIRDYIFEDDEPDSRYVIQQKLRTNHQRIAVVEHEGETLIYANGYIMVGTVPGEDLYAESLIHVPMALVERRERVLLLGGGCGITAREVLRYNEVAEVTAVDIDDTMVQFGKNLEALVRFNKGSLHDPRVKTVVQDARAFVEESSDRWDLIVVDLPEPTPGVPELRRCFSREFYQLLAERLQPGGVVVVACANPTWMPEHFWSIHATLGAAGLHVLPYRFDSLVEEEDDWGFCVGALRPIRPEDVRISVQTRHLTKPRMEELFQIPYGIRRKREAARVQTDTNHVLAQFNNYN